MLFYIHFSLENSTKNFILTDVKIKNYTKMLNISFNRLKLTIHLSLTFILHFQMIEIIYS